MPRRFWLVKSEPEVFSFGDLLRAKDRTTGWDGVRNFQARNFLRDAMKKGDGVLFYHSRSEPTAVVGEAEVAREGYPDPTQFDAASDRYDPRARRDAPIWYQVDVRALRELPRPVTLARIKATPELRGMQLVRPGSRLSVQPVTAEEFRAVLRLGERD